MNINPIIKTLLDKIESSGISGIDILIYLKNGRLVYKIDGFYKAGYASFSENEDGQLLAYTRYNQIDEINSYEDILSLNHYWWNYSKNRDSSWESPAFGWDILLVDAGLVTKKEENLTKITYS